MPLSTALGNDLASGVHHQHKHMGGKPRTDTPADRRLKANAHLPPRDVSTRPWSQVSMADYTADEYARACLINLNPPGGPVEKALCKLPVLEPKSDGGKLNINAVHAAVAYLCGAGGGVNAPADAKRAAAQKLMRLYANTLNQPAPAALRQLARS